MPLNPLTGQMEYGDASYDPQSVNAGMAMRGMAKGQVETPMLFQLAESIPGLSTVAAVNAGRYANTLFKGGFADVEAGASGRRLARAQKLGGFAGNAPAINPRSSQMFVGGNSRYKFIRDLANKRAQRANSAPFLSQSLNTNFRPRALRRFATLTALTGDRSTGFYTPFQTMSGMANSAFEKSARLRNLFGLQEKEKAFSGGVLGRIESINRISNLEHTIAKGAGTTPRQAKKYGKAVAQRAKLVENIGRVQTVANPSMATIATPQALSSATRQAAARTMQAQTPLGGMTGPYVRGMQVNEVLTQSRMARAGVKGTAAANAAAVADDPMRAVASTMTTGKISNAITSYYAGAVALSKMTASQQKLFYKVSTRLAAKSGVGRAAYAAKFLGEFADGGKYTGNFIARARGGGRIMHEAFNYSRAGGSTATALKFGGMGATRLAGAALTPLNVLATGQLVYDIGKGIGKVAVAGANFAKDALKSMQGTINKPIFGTGFKDNEVAATSRARGVMAIQNSRLNARSLLGSEASMMAAYFG